MQKVFRKELREMLRDKRVRSAAFFGPIILIVMMMMIFGFILGSVGKRQNTTVHVVKTTDTAVQLLKTSQFNVVEVGTLDEGKKLIQDGKARLVLSFTPEAGQTRVQAFLDPKEQTGQIALSLVTRLYGELNSQHVAKILSERGLPPTAQELFKVERMEVQVGSKAGASGMLVSLLPYLIVIWAFYGGMSIASDLVAGEKEKNTLETLLITPVARTQIVLGKFLALGVVSFISSISSLVGLVLVALLRLPGTKEMFEGGFGVTPIAAVVIIAVMLPMVALFSSILIALSSLARNPREAQTYLTQVSFIVILPAIFSQVIGYTDAGRALWVNFVPILNVANNIRMALMGKFDPLAIGITIAVSAVLALIAVKATVVLFNREEVLVRV